MLQTAWTWIVANPALSLVGLAAFGALLLFGQGDGDFGDWETSGDGGGDGGGD